MNQIIKSETFGEMDLQLFDRTRLWVVPDAGSIMLTLCNVKEEVFDILITQNKDFEILTCINSIDDMEWFLGQIPGRIYVNKKLIPLNSLVQKDLIKVLKRLVDFQLLGHPKGLVVLLVIEYCTFFETDAADVFAQEVKRLLDE